LISIIKLTASAGLCYEKAIAGLGSELGGILTTPGGKKRNQEEYDTNDVPCLILKDDKCLYKHYFKNI
jgi:hypothetical protein